MFAALIDEYRELSPPELDEVIATAELARRQAEAQLAAATSVITDRGSYRDHGYRSVRTYLKGTLNCSGSTANKIRKRGSLLGEHPEVGQAFHEGHIGGDQIDELARAHARRPSVRRVRTDAARPCRTPQAVRVHHRGQLVHLERRS